MSFVRVIALEGETVTFTLNSTRSINVAFSESQSAAHEYEMKFASGDDASDFFAWADKLDAAFSLKTAAQPQPSRDGMITYLVSLQVYMSLRMQGITLNAAEESIEGQNTTLTGLPIIISDYIHTDRAPVQTKDPSLLLLTDPALLSLLEKELLAIQDLTREAHKRSQINPANPVFTDLLNAMPPASLREHAKKFYPEQSADTVPETITSAAHPTR